MHKLYPADLYDSCRNFIIFSVVSCLIQTERTSYFNLKRTLEKEKKAKVKI